MARPTFRYPFAGSYPVSSGFGMRGGGMHTGTDFAVPTGVEILAANNGVVVYAAYEREAGNTVTIRGEDGWQSRYHHLQRWLVGVGQYVRAGDPIGICNNTGSSTGPHLHFEIRTSPSTPIDPLPILKLDAAQGPDTPGGTFTVGQMEDIAQWEKDTRKIVLDVLVGDVNQATTRGLLGQWENDTRAYVDKAIKASEARIIAAINAR
jgi:hypothetical protein